MRPNEPNDGTLRKAKRFLRLQKEYYENPRIAVESEEFKMLSWYFAVLRWSESSVRRYVRDRLAEAEMTLANGNELLHGGGEVVEI